MKRLSAKERVEQNCIAQEGRCGYLEIVVDRIAGEVYYYCLGKFEKCVEYK